MGDYLDTILPLRDIAEKMGEAGISITYNQLHEWERKRESTGFPEPYRELGKYKVYDYDDVLEWLILWRRVTARLGNGERINGTREDG